MKTKDGEAATVVTSAGGLVEPRTGSWSEGRDGVSWDGELERGPASGTMAPWFQGVRAST